MIPNNIRFDCIMSNVENKIPIYLVQMKIYLVLFKKWSVCGKVVNTKHLKEN